MKCTVYIPKFIVNMRLFFVMLTTVISEYLLHAVFISFSTVY